MRFALKSISWPSWAILEILINTASVGINWGMALFATEDVSKIDDLYRQGLWPKIIQNLRKKPLQEYDDIRLLNDFAIAYQQEKQWERVAEVYERIKAIEP